jgi:hypothetical protein
MSFSPSSISFRNLLAFENKKERNPHEKKSRFPDKMIKTSILDASRIFRIISAVRVKKVSIKRKRISRKRQK